MIRKISGLSLIELLIALVMISVVVLAMVHIDVFSHKFVFNASRHTKLQNEVVLVLEHMTKEISRAIGDANNPPVTPVGTDEVRIMVDENETGRLDAGDVQIAYSRSGNQINYCSNVGSCTPESLAADRVVSFTPTLVGNNRLDIRIRSCWNPTPPVPSAPEGTPDNPCVDMSTSFRMPSVSTN